jgi:arylsulfatase A-like enzyme
MRNCRVRFLRAITVALLSFESICVAASVRQDRSASTSLRRDRHVVVVVWDGMRPDFVSEQNTPALWKLGQRGVTFGNHHSVYPTATIVSGTAINTGVYPDHSGIFANHDYIPVIDLKKSIDVENSAVVRKGDQANGGKYIRVPTLAQLIREQGGETAIATAKTVGLLFDRHSDSRRSLVVAGASLSPGIASIDTALGPFPPATQPAERDSWTTRALIDFLWAKEIPAFSLLWLSEPDDTEHKTAPGDPAALAAMKSSDGALARVLESLDKHNASLATDIFVVSDHGFSTISRSIDVPKILREAGFDAVTEFANEPKPGQVMIAGNGGTILFYVIGHEAAITRRLVEFLQQTDFAGVIFTREAMEGTFTLDKAKVESERGPDVEMAFRWNENKNQFGISGMIDADWQRAAGKGTHATLSKFDMHNVLIAAGPDFRGGEIDELPSGNIDLAPTILAILGIRSPAMDGRILSEAMKESKSAPTKAEVETLDVAKKFPSGTWRQSLRISRVGSTIYLDEGNGGFTH